MKISTAIRHLTENKIIEMFMDFVRFCILSFSFDKDYDHHTIYLKNVSVVTVEFQNSKQKIYSK